TAHATSRPGAGGCRHAGAHGDRGTGAAPAREPAPTGQCAAGHGRTLPHVRRRTPQDARMAAQPGAGDPPEMMQRLLKPLRGRTTASRGAWRPAAGPMAAALAVAWSLGWAPALAQERPPEGPANVVNLMASAYQEVAQDRLVLQMSVTREGSDAAQVQTQIREALDEALKLARPHERAPDMEVRTGDFSLNPRYAKDGRIATWVGSAQLVLEGRDFELIARTAGRLTSLTMAGSHFTLSRQARQALEADVQR